MSIRKLINQIDALSGANLNRLSPGTIRERLHRITYGHEMYALGRNFDQVWHRARICEQKDGWGSLMDLIYPDDKKKIGWGRANFPKQQVLYAAWNELTAISEIRAEVGQYVQLIALRPRPPVQIPCASIGEVEYMYHTGTTQVNSIELKQALESKFRSISKADLLKMKLIDGFISSEFRKTSRYRYDYKISATFAKMLFERFKGIIYPSVEVRGGMNIAVPSSVFDRAFEVLWTRVYKVKDAYGYSVYDLELRRETAGFAADGQIDWNSCKGVPFTFELGTGHRTQGEVFGWRRNDV